MNWTQLINTQHTQSILHFIENERKQGKTIYPEKDNIFSALTTTPFEKVKVVILGQDPYHGENQANGLAFSVQKGITIPPSLRNIYKEVESDIEGDEGDKCANHGDLTYWAEQGVLLINTVLTVEANQANSHQNKGWETFTDSIINSLSKKDHIVFILWGKKAQNKSKLIASQHTILTAPHPSPLSAYRGFFGCRHFSLANKALMQHQQFPIDWIIR